MNFYKKSNINHVYFLRSIFPILNCLYFAIDVLISPLVYAAGIILKSIRIFGISKFPICKKVLLHVGVFPIRNHYYEPLFDPKQLKRPLSEERNLTGINWNIPEQLRILNTFQYSNELKDLPIYKTNNRVFYLNNGSFEAGDAEYWYSLIRHLMPKAIIEVGSGYSTLMAIKAIEKNKEACPGYSCDLTCIEPYERPWLDETGVKIVRRKIEDIDLDLFQNLGENDILFIDSSHIIRPQGDITFEYLELLPSLNKGVIVHIHDIFSPRDYPENWIKNHVLFWNEQYLLEAFLTSNDSWHIVGALNYLHHNHSDALKEKCIYLTSDREPGSIYIKKIR